MGNFLVTGAAGFIGYHLSKRLLERGDRVVGFDNLNDYYDVRLKHGRLALLREHPQFRFVHADLADANAVNAVFQEHQFTAVINLAAQAGVRYSLTHPHAYVQSNLTGFTNILEACRHHQIGHLVYASSSSVYGNNTAMPFSVRQSVDHPISLYAATKKANELMAHTYSHLYRLRTTGLRFFTVYGPWGRPDMAMFRFAKAMLAGDPIDVYNYGNMRRDFTYVDDIVEGIVRVTDNPAASDPTWTGDAPNPGTSSAPYRLYNIGNSNPVELLQLIRVLEQTLNVQAKQNLLPMQPGDVPATYADVDDLTRDVHFSPQTSIETGVQRFVDWYRDVYVPMTA